MGVLLALTVIESGEMLRLGGALGQAVNVVMARSIHQGRRFE
jgi:hypothetical protein